MTHIHDRPVLSEGKGEGVNGGRGEVWGRDWEGKGIERKLWLGWGKNKWIDELIKNLKKEY